MARKTGTCMTCGGETSMPRYVRCGRCYGNAKKPDHTCQECKVVISNPRAKRCAKCAGKARRVPLPNCMDCGKRLSNRYSRRCVPCANRAEKHGTGFTRTLKDAIVERDQHTCQHCGRTGVPLHVHHKDMRTDDHSSNNLVTLCAPCHRQCHTRRKKAG